MANTTRKANIEIDVDPKESARQIENVRTELESLGPAGKKSAQGVADSWRATERALDSFDRKLNDTGNVGERDIRRIITAIEVMKSQGIAAFGSLANAPKPFQDAIASAEQKLATHNITVGKLNNAVRDNTAHVQANAGQWSGLGNAIESVGGKTGKIAAGMGLVAAAFGEGWSIGMKLNKLFGTDMSLWEEKVNVFGSKAGAIVRGLSDNVVAAGNVIAAIWNRDWTEFKRSLHELGESGKTTAKTINEAVNSSTEAWLKEHKSVKETDEAMKKAKDTADELAEKKKKLAEEIHKAADALSKENRELDKQKQLAEDATLQLSRLSGDVGYYKRQLESATSATGVQREELQKLSQKYAENDPLVLAAKEKLALLETQLVSATRRFSDTSEEVKKYEQQQQSATTAVAEHQPKVAALTTEQQKQQAKLSELTTGTHEHATATGVSTTAVKTATIAAGEHAAAAGDAGSKVVGWKDAGGHLHMAMRKVADETHTATENTNKFAESSTNNVHAVDAMTEAVNRLATALNSAATAANSLAAGVQAVGSADSGSGASTPRGGGASGGWRGPATPPTPPSNPSSSIQ